MMTHGAAERAKRRFSASTLLIDSAKTGFVPRSEASADDRSGSEKPTASS
jgi:hypothetical protein